MLYCNWVQLENMVVTAGRARPYHLPNHTVGYSTTINFLQGDASLRKELIHGKWCYSGFLMKFIAFMSDHFLVEAEVVVAKEWGNRVVGCRREVVKVEELKKTEKKQEYQDKLKEAYDRVKEREAGELEEEWRLMKESLVGYASDVCGKRFVGGCMRRGSEWWNEGVKMKVEEKKRAFEEWLQCNSVEKYERYREKNVEAKRKVEEAKRMSNFKRGQDFDRSYEENKKKFWKEVRRVKKGGSRTEETVKDVNGRLLRGNEARKRWAEYFEELLNLQEDREADIVAVGGVQVPVMGEENEREIIIEEVKRAFNETKGGKAPGMDGVRVEMLKEGGVTVLEWLVRLFNICFMLSIVPVDWVIACMVPLYKGKGDMYECSNFRGISGVGHITKNSTNVLSACRKRLLKETGRGDWESPPL